MYLHTHNNCTVLTANCSLVPCTDVFVLLAELSKLLQLVAVALGPDGSCYMNLHVQLAVHGISVLLTHSALYRCWYACTFATVPFSVFFGNLWPPGPLPPHSGDTAFSAFSSISLC